FSFSEVTEFGDDDFTFDYEVLRKWGLILAVVFFVLGLTIIFSK
uniref:FXYD domain-containing ion transport regulator n=1 Tax=Scleropages formosus TaxID=113540 RepID=A0A8C9RAV2_SCLFO